MKIRIISWKYENIRKMGNTEINLSMKEGGVYPISLIMMPNGTGKTTTITLMRGLLSGKAVQWNEKTVRSFAPLRQTADMGCFQLKMSFDNKIYYYILKLDYVEGKAAILTSQAEDIGGLEEGWIPPYQLKGIMDNEEFVNRFIFDGEQAKKTLDAGNEEAEKAIINLYQINKLDQMIGEIDELIQIKIDSSTNRNTSRSMKVQQGKLKAREEKLEALKRRLEEIESQLEKKKKEQVKYKAKYDSIISTDERLHERKKEIDTAIEQFQEELGRMLRNTMVSMKKIYNIHPVFDQRLKELVDNMQVLKLPKSTAREFFNELACFGKVCICGRTLEDEHRATILQNAEQYLGQEQLIAVNAIKSSLRDYKSSEDLKDHISELEILSEKIQELNHESKALEIDIADSKGDEAADIQKILLELKGDIEKLEEEKKLISTKDSILLQKLSEDNNIYLAESALEKAKEQYYRASGTYEFMQKANKVKKYLSDIKKEALQKLKSHVLKEANHKIAHIIKNDNIVIEKIEHHLVLKERGGVSDGQTLAIAYAYIGSLFEHAFFEFPFVVDSPAAAMDLDVRREVANVIPELFEQLVIFVTSGEVKGFAETFYKRENVQYLTITGGREEDVECIRGQEFFNNYQTEEEGDI